MTDLYLVKGVTWYTATNQRVQEVKDASPDGVNYADSDIYTRKP